MIEIVTARQADLDAVLALDASAELRGACPASVVAMRLALDAGSPAPVAKRREVAP